MLFEWRKLSFDFITTNALIQHRDTEGTDVHRVVFFILSTEYTDLIATNARIYTNGFITRIFWHADDADFGDLRGFFCF